MLDTHSTVIFQPVYGFYFNLGAGKKETDTMTKKGRNRPVRNIKHGGYSRVWEQALSGRLDNRTTLVKAMNALRTQLIYDLGDNPSTQERILIDRVVVKVFRLQALEVVMMDDDGRAEKAQLFYISLSNSLRRDLVVLGLERSAVAISIEDDRRRQYLKSLSTEELLQLEQIFLRLETRDSKEGEEHNG